MKLIDSRIVRNSTKCNSIIIKILITHKEDIPLRKNDNEIQYQRYNCNNIVSKIYSSNLKQKSTARHQHIIAKENKTKDALKEFSEKDANNCDKR